MQTRMPKRSACLALILSAALWLGFALPLCAQPAASQSGAASLVFRPAAAGIAGRAAEAETALSHGSFRQRVADPWFAPDKAKHLGASFLLTLSGQYVLTEKLSFSEGEALPLAVAGAVFVGLGKEVYDRHRPPDYHFSRRDLVADALGIALGVAVILL